MDSVLKVIFDFFIHPSLKLEKSIYEKAKIVSVIYLTVFLIVSIYTIYYLFNGALLDLKGFANYFGMSISFVCLFLLKKFGKIDLSLKISLVLGLSMVTVSVILAGGIYATDIFWYVVTAASAMMFIDTASGIAATLFALIAVSIFYLLEIFNIYHFKINKVASTLEYGFFNYTLLTIILVLLVYILVRGNNKLQIIIQLSQQQKMREDIANDFYDRIGNRLASLKYLTELVKMSKDEQERLQLLQKIDFNAKDVYDNFRDFIWALDSKNDRVQELFMYLRDFADDCFKFSNTNLYINFFPEKLPELVLPSKYAKEIVPLVKEAIANINKYANAQNVEFNFSIANNNILKIVLKDDGDCMYSLDNNVRGIGLLTMQYRMEKIGAKFTIESLPAKGTFIELVLILPYKGSEGEDVLA